VQDRLADFDPMRTVTELGIWRAVARKCDGLCDIDDVGSTVAAPMKRLIIHPSLCPWSAVFISFSMVCTPGTLALSRT
jgi:hypothetical protein